MFQNRTVGRARNRFLRRSFLFLFFLMHGAAFVLTQPSEHTAHKGAKFTTRKAKTSHRRSGSPAIPETAVQPKR